MENNVRYSIQFRSQIEYYIANLSLGVFVCMWMSCHEYHIKSLLLCSLSILNRNYIIEWRLVHLNHASKAKTEKNTYGGSYAVH